MTDTAERLLDTAQDLVARRGFNAFSYRDLASALGIKTASIHYHFPKKADLGRALVSRYRQRLLAALAELDASTPEPLARAEAFVSHYEDGVREGQMCLCGMLASDAATLPEDFQAEVRAFFDAVEAWLAATLSASGVSEPESRAIAFLATVEGAMLTAWPYHAQSPQVAVSRYRTATSALVRS